MNHYRYIWLGVLMFLFLIYPNLPVGAEGNFTYTRTLAVGSTGTDVSALQQFLEAKGFYTYPTITGYFGAVTKTALAAFQSSVGLDPVGQVGPKTLALLNQGASTSTVSIETTATGTTTVALTLMRSLSLGSTGSDVAALQQFLENEGYYTYSAVTGYFGKVTRDAVIAFQKANSINPVGSVGPLTRALIASMSVAGSSTTSTSASTPETTTIASTATITGGSGVHGGGGYVGGQGDSDLTNLITDNITNPNYPYQPQLQTTTPTPISNAVTMRDPNANDDATKGYVVGNFWNNLSDHQIWEATSVATSSAVWVNVTSAAQVLPGDVLTADGVTWNGLYGFRRMRSAYGTGPAFDVVRDIDGATTTINFLPDGEIDIPTLTAFLANTPSITGDAGGIYNPQVGSIAKIYNQDGSGNDAVQIATSSRPRVDLQEQIGGALTVFFDDNETSSIPGVGFERANTYLNLPAGITATQSQGSIVAVGSTPGASHQTAIAQIGTAAGSRIALTSAGGATNAVMEGISGASTNIAPSTMLPMVTPAVAAFVSASTTGGTQIAYDGTYVTATSTPTGTTAINSGYWGAVGAAAATKGDYESSALITASTSLSSQQLSDVTASLIYLYNLTPQVQDTLVFDGDSWFDDQSQTAYIGRTPERLIAALLSRPYRIYDLANSGDRLNQPVAEGLGGRIYRYPAYAAVAYNPFASKNIFIEEAAQNDAAWIIPYPGNSQSVSSSKVGEIYAANGSYYTVVTPGTTSAYGPGPYTTGNGITDGTVVWNYYGPSGAGATSIYNSFTTIKNMATATGYTVLGWVPPARTDSFPTWSFLESYMPLARANAAGAAEVIDVAGDQYLGDPGNRAYWNTDNVHLIDPGWVRLSQIIAYAVNKLN